MAETIRVRENSAPGGIEFVLRDFRNADDPTAVVDITGYAFNLVVKREADDLDSAVLFDLSGTIVTAASGIYRFTLTSAHTSFAPGTYLGEIRYWSGGAPATETPPTDAIEVSYEVFQRIRLNEP